MSINFVDAIPNDKPHCGNCVEYNKEKSEELFRFCAVKDKDVPSFGVCDNWIRSSKVEEDSN